MSGLKERQLQPELMDQPGLAESAHCHALDGLRRVNTISRTAGVLWREMSDIAQRNGATSFRVLDLASGGGDVALHLAAKARSENISATIVGWDISQTAVRYASQRAECYSNVSFAVRNAVEDRIEAGFDFIICSLFLHHLEKPAAVHLLQKMGKAAERAVLADDLRRTRSGYALAWLGCRLLTRSSVVHVDGPLSVRAAFTMEEIGEMASDAGLEGADILPHWPQRFLLKWIRS